MTAPPTSVPHALARRRAQQIGHVRYQLILRIDAHARVVRGRSVVEFELMHARSDVLLDWRPQCSAPALDAALRTLRINARAPSGRPHAGGHLHIRARDLVPGLNRLEMAWRAPIGSAGAAIARFVDPIDGSAYVHTLFVPDEASRVFPCFDQPDLKAVFELTLQLPARWRAIANAPIAAEQVRARARIVRFAATEPISTYVFAFATGPWIAIVSEERSDTTRLWGRRSQRRRLAEHAPEILRLNRVALRFYSDYLAHPFAFAKYDLIAIPQFPYRGMEHAGATFLDEDAVLLGVLSGAHARFLRAQLIYHETAHQWMGDLVTMRWFDDLWFKEGHANFLAYRLAQHTLDSEEAEIEFMALRSTAYRTECSPGATALHHPLADLADAKAAYGSMVYAKAPAVLRTLERTLGSTRFRRALRDLVRCHAFGAIDWRDWVHACERAARRSLTGWARAWLLRPGVAEPRVRTIAQLLQVDSATYAIPRPTRTVLAAIPRQLARTHSGVHRCRADRPRCARTLRGVRPARPARRTVHSRRPRAGRSTARRGNQARGVRALSRGRHAAGGMDSG